MKHFNSRRTTIVLCFCREGNIHMYMFMYTYMHMYISACVWVYGLLCIYWISIHVYMYTQIHKYSTFPGSSISMCTQLTLHTNETNMITTMGHIRPFNQCSANGYWCFLLKSCTQHVQLVILRGPPSTDCFFTNTWLQRRGRKLVDSPASYAISHFVCVWATEFKPCVSAACKVAWGLAACRSRPLA